MRFVTVTEQQHPHRRRSRRRARRARACAHTQCNTQRSLFHIDDAWRNDEPKSATVHGRERAHAIVACHKCVARIGLLSGRAHNFLRRPATVDQRSTTGGGQLTKTIRWCQSHTTGRQTMFLLPPYRSVERTRFTLIVSVLACVF